MKKSSPTWADIIRAKNEIKSLEVCIGLVVDKNPNRIYIIAQQNNIDKIRAVARKYSLNEYHVEYEKILIFGYD